MKPKDSAIEIWRAGVAAVDGYGAVAGALAASPAGAPDRIVAVGKAAAAMARAALDHFGTAVPTLVVTKYGHAEGLPQAVEYIESAHPTPDENSLTAGRALRRAVGEMPNGSELLLLVSGGASALAEDLVAGATLADLADLNRKLLATGLDIARINAQRRRLSRIKGGGLLSEFCGRRVQMLAISDVPGDDIAVIGSGIGAAPDTPAFSYDPQIVGSNGVARSAAAAAARKADLRVLIEAEALHDDINAIADVWGPRIRSMASGAMVLGGEPTVILPDSPGQGGRNQALALALSRHIAGTQDLAIVVAGTDGTDGPTDAAGGIVDGTTWGAGAAQALALADSGAFLETAGALLTTGPTGTNVMDLLVAVRA